jgi:N-acetyl-alpha-D-glucosaminyl L-malate synthase BshA
MKIGIVCYPTFGGSGVVATELGIGLAGAGHEVHFITYKRPVRLTSFHTNIFFHEVSALEYPLFEYTPYESSLASKLVDVIRFEHLDILHVHYAIPHATVAYITKQILAAQGIKLPVITTLHGTDITLVGADSSFSPVVEFSINQSDGVTAVSEHLKTETLQNFNIAKDIRVIPNFIDFTRFRKINKDHFRKAIASQGEKILIHISNFRKVKRVEDIVRIFEIVHREIPSKLLLIGDGPERKNLEDLCRQLEIVDDVKFLGKQEAVEELLAISDVFILPSENESFGLAALEAMACEVPVVSSNAGGIPEVNVDGVTGYVCEIGDIRGMAEKCISILSDDKKLSVLRKQAFEHAKKFDINNLLEQYINYYEEIIQKVNS